MSQRGYGGVSRSAASAAPGTVTLPHVDQSTSTGPAATGGWEDLGAAYDIPANTWGQNGDTLRVTLVYSRTGVAGLGDARILLGGTDTGQLTSFNRSAGAQGSAVFQILLTRTAADTVTVTGFANANGSVGPASYTANFPGNGVTGLTFTGSIELQPQVQDSGSTNCTTRLMFTVERLRKSA